MRPRDKKATNEGTTEILPRAVPICVYLHYFLIYLLYFSIYLLYKNLSRSTLANILISFILLII